MSLFVPQQPNAPSTPDQASASQGKARPGFSDALGDRQISVDSNSGTKVEILKFKKEFGQSAPFEAALRKRVDELRRLLHPSLPALRAVDQLEDGSLALVSDHIPGRRLSEILLTVRGPVFAVELIRQLTPAIATIQRPDPQLSHGLITADRVIVTREGRLVIVEHALGSAVESLKLSADRLRSQFGLAMSDQGGPVRLDQRMDVIQLGFVALTLLLGRRLDPGAFRAGIPALLDEFTQASPRDSAALRPWFERALQIGERPFETAEDALDAIEELPEQDELGQKGPQRSILMFKTPSGEPQAPPLRPVPVPAPTERQTPEKTAAASSTAPKANAQPAAASRPAPEPAEEEEESLEETETDDMAATARTSRKMMWVAAGFAVLSAAQAAVIVMMVMRQSPNLIPSAAAAPLDPVASQPAPAPMTATPPVAAPPLAPAPVVSPTPAATAKPADAAPAEVPPLGGRIGGVRVTSTVELQVFQDESLLGTTAGPIALPEGSHTLDFVNESLGYRSRQTVAVKAGQLAALRLSLPQGRININATPWANVWINGNAAGETPIANLTLPIGNHEIVFRHPQLGEQRMTATVKADGVARVSASFQR